MTKNKYRVIIDENFHFMDTDESYGSGTFDTYEQAVEKCKRILNEFLEDAVQKNDTVDSLYMTWVMYGESPHIDGDNLGSFSTRQYVERKCNELTKSR